MGPTRIETIYWFSDKWNNKIIVENETIHVFVMKLV